MPGSAFLFHKSLSGQIFVHLLCELLQTSMKKNREPRDIKSHHFILSFDPKDAECGLTLEKAQALRMEFARKHFSGHQCVVAI